MFCLYTQNNNKYGTKKWKNESIGHRSLHFFSYIELPLPFMVPDLVYKF